MVWCCLIRQPVIDKNYTRQFLSLCNIKIGSSIGDSNIVTFSNQKTIEELDYLRYYLIRYSFIRYIKFVCSFIAKSCYNLIIYNKFSIQK